MLTLKGNLANFFFEDDQSRELYLKKGSLDYLASGKALRSRICVELGDLLGAEGDHSELLGQTIEMIHNATLIHDDVVDYSHFRRGSETLNSFYGNKKSVLVGDYILAKAIFDLSTLNKPTLIGAIAHALKCLVDGEIFQMEHSNPFVLREEDYIRLAKNKTGALFAWCFSSVVDLQFSSEDLTEAMHELGEELGVLFQIKDDLLDFTVQEKTTALDLRNNNINYVFSLFNDLVDDKKSIFKESAEISDLPVDLQNYLQSKRDLADEMLIKRATRVKNLTREICDQYLAEKYWGKFNVFIDLILAKIINRTH